MQYYGWQAVLVVDHFLGCFFGGWVDFGVAGVGWNRGLARWAGEAAIILYNSALEIILTCIKYHGCPT